MISVKDATELCIKLHEGQTRRDGSPYHMHSIRVANKVTGKFNKVIALLHDVLEDTNTTKEDLLRCGVPIEIIFYLNILCKKKEQPYLDYIDDISILTTTTIIKLADIEDNMEDCPSENQKKKYPKAIQILNTQGE